VSYQSNHRELLRQFHYEDSFPSETSDIPDFYYEPVNSLALQRLRDRYTLDLIAGTGEEWSRIYNLCRWVHGRLKHDGSSKNPKTRTALHILNRCYREECGVNCRMIAIVFAEICLALGIPARYLICLPYNTEDYDCHVITIVYSTILTKWLYIDPTYMSYWTDPLGALLSPSEVRKRLANEQEICLNPDANLNGDECDAARYEEYMVKNLFRFICPLASQVGYDESLLSIYVALNPKGFQSLRISSQDPSAPTRLTYNQKYFWSSPNNLRI
jgi:hypothetical protein